MNTSNLVRSSRDGDQFHYLWAARRCLLLLSPASGLVAVSIEGASTSESDGGDQVEEGEEIIDVGEYYGSEAIEEATLIRYTQLKHSTQRANQAWTASGLEKTLHGFAKRYKAFGGTETIGDKLEFCFVSNRPISSNLLEAVEDAANNAKNRHPVELKKIQKFTNLKGLSLADFCKLLHVEGKHSGYWDQRNILAKEVNTYLPGADVDAPVQLKELVTRKALSENAENPSITKNDVLLVLKTKDNHLFPAPCQIEDITDTIPREQEGYLVEQIINAGSGTVLVHANGGVGKSIFSIRIKFGLPAGSVCVVYDCFGDGQYRNASAYRHRHKDALVQIANELASKGLCDLLIPAAHADSTAYLQAFLHRLRQAIVFLKGENPEALLCIVVDAADNAQMAAEETFDPRSFARDLLREQMPDGVRLVMLCRTHRQEILNPPLHTLRLELQPFTRSETAIYLRNVFPNATEQDVAEFHRLSSQNPRVQATALSQKATLSEILRALGPNPTTVEDTIATLLKAAIDKLRDKVGPTETAQINMICEGLAVLRPLIPISVLASISGVNESAVKSFAIDIGRPLITLDNTIQFFDEPAETWFRKQFKPKAEQLAAFIEILKPLASTSAYVASTLPQIMLEAGQFAGLVELALSSGGLPEGNPVEKRDVELQRLQFALKASLRAKRHTDAAKLALKAGGEVAGGERQQKLLQNNTDLAAVFMDTNRIQEIVSRRTFVDSWTGSHHVYEAGIMSAQSDLHADARSRLRMAHEWLKNWARLSEDERDSESIEDEDIAELALAHFNIDGASFCAHELRRWMPRAVSFRAGRILARRFVDHGRYDDLDQLALAAEDNVCLISGITVELREVHRNPPKEVVEYAINLVVNASTEFREENCLDSTEDNVRSITALVEAGLEHSTHDKNELALLLAQYLPESPPPEISSRYGHSRFSLLRAYALRAALDGRSLELVDLAHSKLRKKLENSNQNSQDVQEFKEDIGTLLPWHQLWANIILGHIKGNALSIAIDETVSSYLETVRSNHREASYTLDEIAYLWFDILARVNDTQANTISDFDTWINSLHRPPYTRTFAQIARLAARRNLAYLSLEYASKSFSLTNDKRMDAEEKVSAYIDLSRAILPVSKSEAAAYFDKAVEVASKIGDENTDRWVAILDLADRAADRDHSLPEIAYRLARCAELTYDYSLNRDEDFYWEATTRAIAGLCPSSSIAILSRWRDRGIGRAERIFPAAIHFLTERGSIDPKAALSFIGFRSDWDKILLLKCALEACVSKNEKRTALDFFYRYLRLDEQSASTWGKVKEEAAIYGLTLSDIDELIAFCERKKQSSQSSRDNYTDSASIVSNEKNEQDWDAIFSGIDLSSANDISRAYRCFKDSDFPYYHDRFFKETCTRVIVGKEAELVRAILYVAEFDLYHFRIFLEVLPDEWRTRLAVKSALADTAKSFCRRYCMDISKNRYYEVLPFQTIYEFAGVEEGEIFDIVVSAIGESTELVGADRLFTLVGLIAFNLSHTEALEALTFGLSLFDGMLKESDGDGPWSPALAPPIGTDAAIAGYIWGGLAAPKASLRWEAAHVVRGLCTLGRENVVSELIKLATVSKGGAFADARLHFYHLHARQWLLIALARVANENPAVIALHTDFFMHLALGAERHVLIRGFAAKVLLSLANSGSIDIEPNVLDELNAVNEPKIPVVVLKQHEQHSYHDHPIRSERESKRFRFPYDINHYWFEGLGRCFAKTSSEIEEQAEKVIWEEWNLIENGDWDSDERRNRGLFRENTDYHSHGSYPLVDNLDFYLSYHAMMTVAGNLLDSVPLYQEPDDLEDDFIHWLDRYNLSRSDGNWLSDRRDSAPLDWPSWKDEKQDSNWRFSVVKEDFERVLGLPGNILNLWGGWTLVSGRREESIFIRSALVSPERSDALLRALQTASDPSDYGIPKANGDLQIDSGEFLLKGWVMENEREIRLDKYDPWAGNKQYPPIIPAEFVSKVMKLGCDSENRVWHLPNDQNSEAVVWSQMWGYYHEKEDETGKEEGKRLQASFPFIMELLTKMSMNLTVKVQIERKARLYRYETRDSEEELKYIPRYTKVFIISHEGRIYTI